MNGNDLRERERQGSSDTGFYVSGQDNAWIDDQLVGIEAATEEQEERLAQQRADDQAQLDGIAQATRDAEEQSLFDDNFGRNNRKEPKVDSHGDKFNPNYNADEPSANIDDTRDKEEASGRNPKDKHGGKPKKSRLRGMMKKYGPTMAIFGGVLGGGGILSVILLPGSLLVSLTDMLTNDGSDSTRTNIIMRRSYIGSLIGKADCSKAIKCKMTTASETQVKEWEKQGFKVDAMASDVKGDEKGDYKTGDKNSNGSGERYQINKITFPDGAEASSGEDFHKHADNTPEGRLKANRVINNRSSFFQNSKFSKVLEKFDIKKSKILKSSAAEDKDSRKKAIANSFDENSKSSADENKRKENARSKIKEFIERAKAKKKAKEENKVRGRELHGVDANTPIDPKSVWSKIGSVTHLKGSGAADLVSTVCMAYNMVRATNAAVKAYWIYQLVNFGFPFIQAGAQMKYYGHITPEVSEAINDRLTYYYKEENLPQDRKDEAGLTAMDAQGVKQAIYGDTDALRQAARDFSTGAPLIATAGTTQAIMDTLQGAVGGKDNLHNICMTANGASALSSVACLSSPIGLALCTTAIVGMAVYGDEIMDKVIELISEDAIKWIAEMDVSSNLKGVRAGEALAAGVGLMLTKSSMGNGLKPSKSMGQIKKFISSTDDLNYKYGEEIARLEARDTPWDIYNQYSFAGQLARTLNPYAFRDKTAYGFAANMLATVSRPLLGMTKPVNALYSQPSNMTLDDEILKNRVEKCSSKDNNGNVIDKEMIEMGYACDTTGRMIGNTNEEIIKAAKEQASGKGDMIIKTIDYMIDNEYIDDNGKTREKTDKNRDGKGDDDKADDNQYNRYLLYCTEEREAPLGMQYEPVEEGTQTDQDWFIGKTCGYNGKDDSGEVDEKLEMLNNFAIYFNYCEVQMATADGVDNCWEDKPAGSSTPSQQQGPIVASGEWAAPTSGPCSSQYGDRSGGHHAGVDIAPAAGTPVVAPADMEIIKVENTAASGGFGNSVVGRTADGYTFRFSHLEDGSIPVQAGQRISKGTQIGAVGNTGKSTGPHLDLMIWNPGDNSLGYNNAVDPVPVLAAHGVNVSC